MVTLEVVAILLSGVGISGSLLYYANVLRNASKARQREMIYQKFQMLSEDYLKTYFEVSTYTDWKTVEEFMQKYGRWINNEASVKLTYILSVYNMVGIYWKEENVDLDFLLKLYPANAIIRMWESFEPVIQEIRKITGYPDYMVYLEYIYRETKKRYPDITSLETEKQIHSKYTTEMDNPQ